MPLVQVFTNSTPPEAKSQELLRDLSRLLAEQLGKPESYVMTNLVPGQAMTFGGTDEPTCFVAVKNIGRFQPEQTKALSQAIASRLQGALGVPASRTYVEFVDATGYLWGYDGDTFG